MRHLIILVMAVIFTACISDDISTSPSHLPEFSADTIALGEVWADELSPKAELTIYNRNSQGITISAVSVTGRDAGLVKLNLDGMPVDIFSPVDIRQNDSVLLLAAAVPDLTGTLDATVNITVNTVTLSLPVRATVHCPMTLSDHTVNSTMSLSGEVRVFGALTVAPGAVLIIEPGTTLYMHDKAEIIVNGQLIAEGTPQQQITICGDRFGFLAADIPYAILPGQWRGITVDSSEDNRMECVSVLNPEDALTLLPDAGMTLTNCRIANARGTLIAAGENSNLSAFQCQFTEAAQAVVSLTDAHAYLYRCTIANSYLFSTPFSSLIELNGASELIAEASVIYRPGDELSASSQATYRFTDTLFGSKGSDDEQFTNCLWAENPKFNLDLAEYRFDYTLSAESPARKHRYETAVMPLPVDRLGTPLPEQAPLGAYN